MSSSSMSSSVTPSSANAASPQLPYPLRLPSYRSSYCARYHPYGRKPSDRKVDLMKTIDMRFCDARVQSRASLSLSVVEEEEETDPETEDSGSESMMTTEQPPDNALAVTTTPAKVVIVRQRSFTNVVIAFALAMRRTIQFRKMP